MTLMRFRFCALMGAVILGGVFSAPAPGAQESEASQQEPQIITLEDAVGIALENNYTVRIAAQQVRSAGGQVAQAKSGKLPQVNASVVHTRTGPITTVTFPTPTGEEEIEIGTPESTRTRLSLALPIDVSGRIGAAQSAASFNLLAAEFSLAAARQQVALQVQEAYLGVLRAQGLSGVADEAVTAAQEHLRIAQLNFDAGTVAYFDVLRAEVQLANFQQRLVEAENAVELSMAGLNFAMGQDVNLPLVVVAPLQTETPAPPPLAASQQEARRRRPELLQARALRRAAEKGIDVAKAGYLPSLALEAGRNYDSNPSSFGGVSRTWDVTAALSVPIFDGWRTKGQVTSARADAEAAGQAEQLTRDRVALEVRQAHLQILEAQERLRVAEKDVEQAREALRLSQLRYKAGLSPSIEATDAEVALAQSRTNQVNAYYDYLLSQARLERAVGRPNVEAVAPETEATPAPEETGEAGGAQ